MRFTAVFVAALSAAGAIATATNPFSQIPGYPLGNGQCLTDAQANFLAEVFRQVLANPDRKAAATLANAAFANSYTETSDSINILAGYPLGGPSFNSKQAFISGATSQPALPGFKTMKVFHDCKNVLWQWVVTGLGSGQYEVKGFNSFIADPFTGQIQSNNVEFNSVAWGEDIGWTCKPPGQ